MDIEIPEEPVGVKKDILDLRETLGSDKRIDWDSLSVWYGNKIPQYLWNSWKSELKKEGYNWQKFLKLMKYRTDDTILWVSGSISWEDFMNRVVDSIEGDVGEIVLEKKRPKERRSKNPPAGGRE